jgi:hypothetical protein
MNSHIESLSPKWILESLENDYKGQNSMDRGVPYIIQKLLELICLKWARMTHLNI